MRLRERVTESRTSLCEDTNHDAAYTTGPSTLQQVLALDYTPIRIVTFPTLSRPPQVLLPPSAHHSAPLPDVIPALLRLRRLAPLCPGLGFDAKHSHGPGLHPPALFPLSCRAVRCSR